MKRTFDAMSNGQKLQNSDFDMNLGILCSTFSTMETKSWRQKIYVVTI